MCIVPDLLFALGVATYVSLIFHPLEKCNPCTIFGTEVGKNSTSRGGSEFLSHHLLGNYAATIIISGGASAPQGRVLSRDFCLLMLNISAAFIIPADENLTGHPPPTSLPLIIVATSSG